MPKHIPRGDEHLICPLHKLSMDQVCHRCPWWYQVRGTNKNTGEEVDEWKCAVAILPLLMVETADKVRQADATMQAMRNEAKAAHDENITVAAIAAQRARDSFEHSFVNVVGPLIQGRLAHDTKLIGS